MKTLVKRLLGITRSPRPAAATDNATGLLEYTFPALHGSTPIALSQFAGKVILVVNTASQCAFTSQYEGLEKLYARLKDQGLVVLGFPSNDFGQQEPGNDDEVATFCRLSYGVEFPMVSKTSVKGKNANPFFARLARITGSTPKWNFHKYLINRDASQVVAFTSLTSPDNKRLLKKIDAFLYP